MSWLFPINLDPLSPSPADDVAPPPTLHFALIHDCPACQYRRWRGLPPLQRCREGRADRRQAVPVYLRGV
jgi:hypothetical protein